MDCVEKVCLIGSSSWYLDFTGWRGPFALAWAAAMLVLAAVAVTHYCRRQGGRWNR